ncbi:hypothetical protein [Motiliproteus sp. MSK22-1]|uniref:hypothetical protein n=1 Tax=Motiliproteus sp. MSK22-1 TaxID=1897630 RepID=UPI0009774B21|nr:hypothetical protein [Motiliproteus sp. MSK22-1]OMH37509.1 hypothetical protein BGP75_09015 [Motiliproteus sp. MSK22-1]
MKKFFLVLGLTAFFSLTGFTAVASEKPTCEDLTQIADDLDEISAAFADVETIKEGDAVDVALGEIVDALYWVSEAEGEDHMTAAVNSLTDAYDNMDGEKFGLALDSVVANMDRLYRRDCQ